MIVSIFPWSERGDPPITVWWKYAGMAWAAAEKVGSDSWQKPGWKSR